MKNRILVSLGLRSRCCGAKIVTWHAHKEYCANCESWLNTHTKNLNKSSHPKTRATFRAAK